MNYLTGTGVLNDGITAPNHSNKSKTTGPKRIGVGMHSYGAHWKAAHQNPAQARFHNAFTFLEYAHQLGAGGVQVHLGMTDPAELERLKSRAAVSNLYLEAQTSLPTTDTSTAWDRFEADIRAAQTAGSHVLRTALLAGRRYETFSDPNSFREFTARATKLLHRAEPILQRHRVILAVENHKDWRVPELLDLMQQLSSEWIRITLDTGNSIALLEDPLEVVQALAPFAVTIHLKDMAVAETANGFLLSEVPLGRGFLDLQKIIEICQNACSSIHFNLEMITRDPLRIPCLTPPYWATMETLPARELARTFKMIRSHLPRMPLPNIQNLSFESLLTLEDTNVRHSLAYAAEHIQFA